MGKKKKAKKKTSTTIKKTILAVVDVGGNSISLEFRCADNPLKKDRNLPPKYRQFCGLAESIGQSGQIEKPARKRALAALREIKDQIDEMEAAGHTVFVKAIGTAPFRNAKNGATFAQTIRNKTGIPLEIISGIDEASYAAEGILAHFPDISGVVTDTGGGSTEFAVIENGEVIALYSLPLGMLRLAAEDDPQAFIDQQLAELPEIFKSQDTLIITGGINRAVSRAFAKARKLKIPRGQDIRINVMADAFTAFAGSLSHETSETLESKFCMDTRRTPHVGSAATLLESIRSQLGAQEIVLNRATIRDGIRVEMLSALSREVLPAPEPLAVIGTQREPLPAAALAM